MAPATQAAAGEAGVADLQQGGQLRAEGRGVLPGPVDGVADGGQPGLLEDGAVGAEPPRRARRRRRRRAGPAPPRGRRRRRDGRRSPGCAPTRPGRRRPFGRGSPAGRRGRSSPPSRRPPRRPSAPRSPRPGGRGSAPGRSDGRAPGRSRSPPVGDLGIDAQHRLTADGDLRRERERHGPSSSSAGDCPRLPTFDVLGSGTTDRGRTRHGGLQPHPRRFHHDGARHRRHRLHGRLRYRH